MLISIIGSVKQLRRLGDGDGNCEPGSTVDALYSRKIDIVGSEPGVNEFYGVGVRGHEGIHVRFRKVLAVPASACCLAIVTKKNRHTPHETCSQVRYHTNTEMAPS